MCFFLLAKCTLLGVSQPSSSSTTHPPAHRRERERERERDQPPGPKLPSSPWPRDAYWCLLVRIGAYWCLLVLIGAYWCVLVHPVLYFARRRRLRTPRLFNARRARGHVHTLKLEGRRTNCAAASSVCQRGSDIEIYNVFRAPFSSSPSRSPDALLPPFVTHAHASLLFHTPAGS
jgi:hypothetical protein